jgi:hypothetical protein
VFTIAPQVVRSLYDLLPRFRGLVRRYASGGTFANDYTRACLAKGRHLERKPPGV